MAEALPVESPSGDNETDQSNKCASHQLVFMTGCLVCLKFYCPVCLYDRPACISPGEHKFSGVDEVVKKFKSELKINLQSVLKKCDILEDEGRTALEELENEKQKVINLFDAEREKIQNYLKEVREKSIKVSNVTDILMKSEDAATFMLYCMPDVETPTLTLQKTNGSDCPVKVSIDSASAAAPMQHSITLKCLPTPKSAVPKHTINGDSKALVNLEILMKGSNRNPSYNTVLKIYAWNVDDFKLVINQTVEGRRTLLAYFPDRSLFLTGYDENSFSIHAPDKPEERFQLESSGYINDQYQIFGKVRTGLILSNGDWIILKLNVFILFYSNINSSTYTRRGRQILDACGAQVNSSITLNLTDFCLYGDDRLAMFKFTPPMACVEQQWYLVPEKGRSFQSGCYSEILDIILLVGQNEVIVVNPSTGSRLCRVAAPEFGIDSNVVGMTTFEDKVLLKLNTPDTDNKLTFYKIEYSTNIEP